MEEEGPLYKCTVFDLDSLSYFFSSASSVILVPCLCCDLEVAKIIILVTES